MKKKVEVYTQPECPPCKVVKQFLEHHSIPFEEYDVTKDMKARSRMIHEFQSYSTPTISVDGEIVTGFDLKKLTELLQISED